MPRNACSLATAACWITAALPCFLAASWAWVNAPVAVVHNAPLTFAFSTTDVAFASASDASSVKDGLAASSAAWTPDPRTPPSSRLPPTAIRAAIRNLFIPVLLEIGGVAARRGSFPEDRRLERQTVAEIAVVVLEVVVFLSADFERHESNHLVACRIAALQREQGIVACRPASRGRRGGRCYSPCPRRRVAQLVRAPP